MKKFFAFLRTAVLSLTLFLSYNVITYDGNSIIASADTTSQEKYYNTSRNPDGTVTIYSYTGKEENVIVPSTISTYATDDNNIYTFDVGNEHIILDVEKVPGYNAERYKENSSFYYLENDDGITITMVKKDIESLTIPEVYEGKPIKQILKSAFFDCYKLEKLSIPGNLEINFSGYYPANYFYTGGAFLDNCISLKEIEDVNPDNTKFHDDNGVLFYGDALYCYPACKEGETYTLPDYCIAISSQHRKGTGNHGTASQNEAY